MADPLSLLAAGAGSLTGLAVVAASTLHGWNAWLDLKRAQIASNAPSGLPRSDIAALRERVRRLEAIADGAV